jgi:hypothetical protein
MARRWVPAVLVVGLLAGCGSATTAGRGTPEAVPAPGASTAPGLPVPDDPTTQATTSAPPPTTTAPRTTPAGRPCPADVAATLPGSPSATLVAGYRTARFRLYVCRTAGGQLYYRGISRADARQATTIAATTIPGGYEARKVVDGHLFVYQIAQRRLVVAKDGKRLLVDPITATL